MIFGDYGKVDILLEIKFVRFSLSAKGNTIGFEHEYVRVTHSTS
jgi:hypothetical protein